MTLRVHPTQIVRESLSPLVGTHASWVRVRLGDVADIQNGGAFKSALFDSNEGVPLLRIRDIADDKTVTRYKGSYEPEYVVEPGDIVIGMDGDFRIARWRGPRAVLNQRVCRLTVRDRETYDENFLLYAMPGYLDAIHSYTSSVTVKHLSSNDLKEIPLPLPPRAEQSRIVAAIEEQFSRLDAGVASLQRAHRNLKRMRAAVLQAAVTGRLVAQDSAEEPSEIALLDAGVQPSVGRDLPSGWSWVRLGDLAKVGSGATPLRSRRDFWQGGSIPWVTSGQLNYEWVREAHEFITEKAVNETAVKLWPPRTLLVAMYGEGQTRGKCSELLIEATTNQACAAIVLHPSFEDVRPYAKMFLRASYEVNRRLAAGGVQPNLSLGLIKSLLIPLPPQTEQVRIVTEVDRQLSLLSSLEEVAEQALVRSSKLRRSVLAIAFKGRLVPQDSDDEPASALSRTYSAAVAKRAGLVKSAKVK